MIGSELLVVPNLSEQLSFQAYFPKGNWYDLRNQAKQVSGTSTVTSNLMEPAPVFFREGKTIFMQNVDDVLNVFQLDDCFQILVALTSSTSNNLLSSEGYLPALNNYNNKKNVENCIYKDCAYKILSFLYSISRQLIIRFIKPNYVEKDFKSLKLSKIRVFGIETSKTLKSDNKFLMPKLSSKIINDHTVDLEFEGLIEINIEKDHEFIILFD